MRIGIYDPYLDTLGGGEKYVLTAASLLANHHDVTIFWDNAEILQLAQKRFDIHLEKITLAENIFLLKNVFFKKMLALQKYDVILFVSDGSIPWLFGKKNILLFQFPINWVDGKNFLNRLKLKRIDVIICYSDFVREFLEKTFQSNVVVIPPPVSIEKIHAQKKENIILSVGRFTRAMNAKKQEFLIESFITMCKKGLSNWKLILIGSSLSKDNDFIEKIKEIANGYPIEILNNTSFKVLNEYYGKAKIYWHATGFGEDLQKSPEKAEHFGIATVEAMAGGAIPIVINAGGQREIIDDNENGFLWNTREEMIAKTFDIIKNEKVQKEISKKAIQRSKDFSTKVFYEDLEKLLEI